MKYILITNNNKVKNFYKETDEVIYLEGGNSLDVLSLVKEKIELGHELLTDPIMSNVADSKNPYKSIAISSEIIKNIEKSKKFIKCAYNIAEKMIACDQVKKLEEEKLKEYRYVDLNLIGEGVKAL